ncbi:MAG TPA: indolepyruvate oxidoreductase subunit beta family protein [Xanthobacteraceae bacterium]
MERSFKTEVEALKLGDGETFRGEGILAVTKALLQSGVSYVGGYQGAPVSHLIDVMVEAQDLLADLGVHVETCTNEAAAAAMLGASINYPLRGAVTWKSIVGTNVAADALSNLASPGVIGGTLIILGEDYGEGASVIQERSYAYAMKSSIWLLDPRPDLSTIVRMVEMGFELSEASHAPVMLELRIRACHVTGAFAAKTNRRAAYSSRNRMSGPPAFDYGRLAHPPLTFVQERRKVEDRLPAALAFIRAHKLNETLSGDLDDVGIIVMGGLANGVLRALTRLGLANAFGKSRIPMLVLNVVYPLDGEELRAFCAGKRAVLVVEEGFPDYIEQAVNVELRRGDLQTRVLGKGVLPRSGEYQSDILLSGLAGFVEAARPGIAREEHQGVDARLRGLCRQRPDALDADAVVAQAQAIVAHKAAGAAAVGALPPRPPTFCTGCPERPVFTAIKLMQRELGPTHISADIGCHSFATFAPFSLGNSILGYGMSLASAAAVGPNLAKRPIAVMGDGGFWHNGLITGVASHLFNQGDGVLIVMQNGYASATGLQYLPSSQMSRHDGAPAIEIERTLRALGVKWLRKVRTYSVATMAQTLKEAMRTAERGLKVIISDGECQLARQRRVRAEDARKLARGERVVRVRYGIDDALCTGDHSCIRLSGCPSLTVKPNPDPLRRDPVATVIESCVGCGLCGEVAHAAVLCPSFYRAEVIRNPGWWDRALHAVRRTVISALLPLPTGERAGVRGMRTIDRPEALTPTLSPAGRESSLAQDQSPSIAIRPITILIAALGGEGGGVLTGWIVRAAESLGLPVQSTSVPGVAQRTGGTTYYVEIWPQPRRRDDDDRPVLALTPGVGDIDLMVASELMEAARTVAAGFVTPDRTFAISSTARSLVMDEKIAMGDGRHDPAQLAQAIAQRAQGAILLDMDAIARSAGAMVNAVMLGMLAGCGRVPIPIEAFEAAIRRDGKAIDGNLRGFRAGLEAARDAALASTNDSAQAAEPADSSSSMARFEREIAALPAAARDLVELGLSRCARYQDLAYARRYLDWLSPIAAADARAGAGGRLVAETARHLALRMTYEDVVKVAQAKIDPARAARIAAELGASAGEPVVVADFLKPGIEEVCSILPAGLARRILSLAQRRGWIERFHWGMTIQSTSVTGFLRFWLLAKLSAWRPRSHRFGEEQRAIAAWLGLVEQAATQSAELALEIVECARLIKGYGDTHKRGSVNYARIVEAVVAPALAGDLPLSRAVDAIASARTAALADPDGESLARCLAEIAARSARPIAAE